MRGKKGPRDIMKKTVPQLQNTLWPLFAMYIKQMHSDGEYVQCFTCDKTLRIGDRDCQAGHFIPRTYSPTKYEEDNVKPQCSTCNEFHHGRPVEFRRRLIEFHGEERVVELERLSTEPWKWDKLDLIAKIAYYKNELAA